MAASPTTVAELINSYRLTNPTDRQHEDARHGRWWAEHLGTLPVTGLTTGRILHAVTQLQSDGRLGSRRGSTVAGYLRFFRRATAWGTCVAMLPKDPCVGLPLPKEGTPIMRVLTEEEETQLCQALGRPYSLWVRFAILTGLKQSEQFTLLWRSVQLERGTVLLPYPSNGTVVDWSLPPDAVTVLRLLRREYPTAFWVFPDPDNTTRPADIHRFYYRWTLAIQRLGLPHLAWKDLRHTCGQRLAKRGVSVEDVATFLRQRELRQAYYYRAWLPGVALKKGKPKPPRVPMFTDLTDGDKRALWFREATAPPLTFGEACRLYAVHHLKQRTSRANFERIYTQLFRQWEARPLADISRKEVRMWFMGLAETPSHANKAKTFLRSLYNMALDMEVYEGSNPTFRIKPYPCQARERFLSQEEVRRFIEGVQHLPPKPRAYFLTLLLTGARLSEVRGMRWAEVDWSTRLWKKSQTKNGKTQFIPLPAQVVEALSLLPRTSEWVFCGDNGQPWSRCNPQKLWQTIRRRWNMKDVTIHDLRRTCASHLAIEGENLPIIQNVLNHTGLAQTATYARLNTKAVDRALQAQADRFCSSVLGPVVLPALTQDDSQ